MATSETNVLSSGGRTSNTCHTSVMNSVSHPTTAVPFVGPVTLAKICHNGSRKSSYTVFYKVLFLLVVTSGK